MVEIHQGAVGGEVASQKGAGRYEELRKVLEKARGVTNVTFSASSAPNSTLPRVELTLDEDQVNQERVQAFIEYSLKTNTS